MNRNKIENYNPTQVSLGFRYLLEEIPEAEAPAPTYRQTAFLAASSSGLNRLQTRGKFVSLLILSGNLLHVQTLWWLTYAVSLICRR
jgi:hypothetical protein